MNPIAKFKSLSENTQSLILGVTVAIIFVVLTVTAPDIPSHNKGNIWLNILFWVVNGPLITIGLLFLVNIWAEVFKYKKHFRNAILVTLAFVMLVIFMASIYGVGIFTIIKHFLINLF